MHRVVFIDRPTLAPQVRLRRPDFAHTFVERDPTSPDEVPEHLQGVTIAMPGFLAMKRRPLPVNAARGGLVDEADLVSALDRDLIAGAGFDVVDGEPPAPDNPLMRAASCPNVILTPHVAWASDEAQQALADQLIDNIENFVAGTPTNWVCGAF